MCLVSRLGSKTVSRKVDYSYCVGVIVIGILQAYKYTNLNMKGSDVLIASAVGVTAVVAAPIVISAVGFGAGGVVVGSFAAAVQTPVTAAGSCFALAQSAGVLGFAWTTKVAILAVAGGVTYTKQKLS